MISCLRASKEADKDEAMENLTRNGGMLLEKLIGFTNGRGHCIGRTFSLHDLNIATHNFDPKLKVLDGGFCVLYKGSLQDRPVIVKKYHHYIPEIIMSDIVFSSQMKVHKNVLKLLGCCLESSVPFLVFEYAEKGRLDRYIFNRENRANFRPLPWKNRLKIAVDVANVIAYLHTAFSRPVVHRHIDIGCILLDKDYGAKVSDFSRSIAMPEGETHIKNEIFPKGSFGYIAPENLWRGSMFNEKVDVYSFGVILLVLLTRRFPDYPPSNGAEYLDLEGVKNLMENDRLEEIIDPAIVEEQPWSGKQQHLKAILMLGLHCTHEVPEQRPQITDVGQQLRDLYQSLISFSVHQD